MKTPVWMLGVAVAVVLGVGPAAGTQPFARAAAADEQREAAGTASQPSDSDRVLAAKLQGELEHDDMLKSARISVTSNGGVATLAGSVPSEAARRHAAEVVSRSTGVKGVENELRVAPPRPMPVMP